MNVFVTECASLSPEQPELSFKVFFSPASKMVGTQVKPIKIHGGYKCYKNDIFYSCNMPVNDR